MSPEIVTTVMVSILVCTIFRYYDTKYLNKTIEIFNTHNTQLREYLNQREQAIHDFVLACQNELNRRTKHIENYLAESEDDDFEPGGEN